MAPDSLSALLEDNAHRLLRNDLPTPLYHQMFTLLRDRILSGDIPCGSRIPTEFDLAEAFGVSRITAKRALDELAARFRLHIDWGLDEDTQALPDTDALLHTAFAQLRERHYCLWTMETGEATLAGFITLERDMEAMQLVASALGMPARPGPG